MTQLLLGGHLHDLARRALVAGILNRTPDSFHDRGRYFALDALLARADVLVHEGADVLDVGGVKAGPGQAVSVAEECDRVIPVIQELRARYDVALSCDTWRAPVAEAAFAAGAVIGNDISGFADPGYLPAAARAGASVVATHIRLAPRIPDPEPRYDDVVTVVVDRLADLAGRAVAAGIPPAGVILDAGLDLGKTPAQSLMLLRASDRLAALGHPVMLSASHKRFLDIVAGGDSRFHASQAAHAIGVIRGARLLRAHDVLAARRVADVLAELVPDQPLGAGPTGAATR